MKLEVRKQKKTKNYNVKESLIINAKGVTLIALVITTIFSYDEKLKSSNNKGFLQQTI